MDTDGGRAGTPVLVVEDDPDLADVVRRYLEHDGYRPTVVTDGVTGLAAAASGAYALVVLDVMLPGMDGVDLCRRLRTTSPVPVIMLTARGADRDRIAGLLVGADDYVTKPFSPRELMLRVAAVLRRAAGSGLPPAPTPAVLQSGPVAVDVTAREASRDGAAVRLTAREFDLLAFFVAHPRQAFSRRELLTRVWGWEFGDTSTVTVHVRRLREKFEDDPATPQLLATVWGVGYRWERHSSVAEPTADPAPSAGPTAAERTAGQPATTAPGSPPPVSLPPGSLAPGTAPGVLSPAPDGSGPQGGPGQVGPGARWDAAGWSAPRAGARPPAVHR